MWNKSDKWNRSDIGRLQTNQDLEDSMSQALADLGMLEQGMTFQDKRDLLNVVRLSQKSARVEEEERKTKTWSPRSQHTLVHSSNPTTSKEIVKESPCKSKEIEIDRDEGDINEDIISNISMALKENQARSKNERGVTQNLEYFGSINMSHDLTTDLKAKLTQGNSPNSPITLSSKDSEIGSVSGDVGAQRNGCENEENEGQQREHQGSDNENEWEIFPSVKAKQKDINNFRKKKDDRERNIDVFSHPSGSDSHNFLRRNLNINQDRIPFYFVPEGMSLRNYIAYFKCCVNQYYKKLAVIQRNNIEHLEWGAPITMDMSAGFTSFRSNTLDAQGDSASKRYNFRDRYPKPKLVDFTSENSEDAEEEESNDEDIFTPHKKLPGIKLSTKRKNTSANDTMSTKKEKKESPQRKLQEDGESIEDDDQEDNPGGDSSDKSNSKNKNTTSSRKRARKSRSKVLQSQNETPEDINEMVPSVAISSIIEPDIVIAEGPTIVSTQPQLDDITNQPSPLSVKQRRMQLRTKSNGSRNRRKSYPPRKNPDVVTVEDDIKTSLEETVDRVRCPICWNLFPASDIEEHASECN